MPEQAATVLLVTSSYDRTIRFWEALSGICSRTIQHPDSQINRLAISNDKRYLAAAGNPNVRIYDAANASSQSPVMSFEGHSGNVTGVQFQANCKWVATCSEDGTLKVFDMRTQSKGAQREYSHGKVGVSDITLHPNQVELISCDYNGSVRIWDLRASQSDGKGACTHELVPEEDAMMRSVSIAPDGSLLTAGTHKGNVYFWKMQASAMTMPTSPSQDFQAITKIKAHDKYMLRSILSPDVKSLATCSADSTIKIWSIANMEQSSMFLPQDAAVNVSKSSTRLPKTVAVPQQVSLKKTLTGHSNWVWDISFSADSEYLVSSSSDHTARLWDLTSGESIRQYQGHHKAAVCVCLNDYSLQ